MEALTQNILSYIEQTGKGCSVDHASPRQQCTRSQHDTNPMNAGSMLDCWRSPISIEHWAVNHAGWVSRVSTMYQSIHL